MIELVYYQTGDVYHKDVVYLATEKKRRLNNTDRRVKRTKKALYDALLTLLKEKTMTNAIVFSFLFVIFLRCVLNEDRGNCYSSDCHQF